MTIETIVRCDGLSCCNECEIEASAIFRDEQGGEYVESIEAEVGQALLLGELTDTWRDMLQQARNGGNPRHHGHDVVRAWPLVGST